ncbi:hypothetical protein [Limnohabitans sp.]|jgi:hypothetical protein|uniref:hypothetical protein n=1 Tax=Limnohabitans sp. TaxID=1907725 RepID=UPI00286EC948|nr:hypothetical protein [Limnohabitans sp.]
MDTKNRKHHEAAAVALKQASVIKTLALASAAFKNGTMKVISPPPSNKDRKVHLHQAT